MPKLNVMAKSSTRRVTIYINGKEVEASVKQIRSEMNKLVNGRNLPQPVHAAPKRGAPQPRSPLRSGDHAGGMTRAVRRK